MKNIKGKVWTAVWVKVVDNIPPWGYGTISPYLNRRPLTFSDSLSIRNALLLVSERVHHGLKNTIHQRIRDRTRISEGVPL